MGGNPSRSDENDSSDEEESSGSRSWSDAEMSASGSEQGDFGGPSRARQFADHAKQVYRRGWEEYPEPEGKAGQIKFGCVEAEAEDCPFIQRLKWDLANSYYWSGNMGQDFLFFVGQWHPGLGIFLSHPNHPWTKRDRVLMMAMSLGLNAVGAASLAKSNMVAFEKFWIFFLITIPDIIYGVIMYQGAIADTRCGWCPCLRPCMRAMKRCLFCFSVVALLLQLMVARVVLGSAPWQDAVEPLVKGKLYSFAIWFPVWLILPCQLGFLDLWCVERRGERRRVERAERAAQG